MRISYLCSLLKIFEEEKTIKKKCLQTEREERAEKFKEEVRIRMAELKEEMDPEI